VEGFFDAGDPIRLLRDPSKRILSDTIAAYVARIAYLVKQTSRWDMNEYEVKSEPRRDA
jgi:hypothetical protein